MIGIIGAMDEEIEILKEKMKITKVDEVANCLFIHGYLVDKEIVLLKSGIGKANAAMATTILHERYQPEFIINTGSAGGFLKDLEVGDVVISDYVVHHDVDATAFEYEYGQVPGMPAMFAANQELIDLAEAVNRELNINSAIGIIATGDVFMSDPHRVEMVRQQFPKMLAAEMEAAAIAQVCHQYNTPFVVIRALSDIAGKESSISFEEFLPTAAQNASDFIIRFLEKVK